MSKRKLSQNQMALALKGLGNFSIMIRKGGDWYASVDAEIRESSVLINPTVSEKTPYAAVAALFAIYTTPGTRVVLNAKRSNEREVRWNGFMWEDAP